MLKSKGSLQINIDAQIKASLLSAYRAQNISIDINLSDGKFIDLIRINKDNMLEVRSEALEAFDLFLYINHNFLSITIGNK